MTVSGPSRARRLFAGWSANLLQMMLGITQQVALVPVFLHFWTSDVLAAWLAVYAAGNLVFIADAGLQFRAINRFLAFKSSVDCDGRTARFYAAMLRVYFGFMGLLAVLLLAAAQVLPPSVVLGFQATSHFDAAFVDHDGGNSFDVADQSHDRALSRPRFVWARGYDSEPGHAGVTARSTGRGGHDGQPAGRRDHLCGGAAGRFRLFSRDRCQPAVSVLARRAGQAILAVGGRAVSPRRSVRRRQRNGAGAAQLAGAAGQRFCIRSRGRGAMGPHARRRGAVRGLCIQTTLPLAAELGHDHAVGSKEQLRNLYARGSVFVALLASLVVSGLLPFWPDFFALWTHGAIPYDPSLTVTLLIGTSVIAPSILALGYANYSNRGKLVARTKGLQLAVFLILSVVLIRAMGPLGAAIAIVASDLLVQFGLLGAIIIGQTLRQPLRHVIFLASVMALVTLGGWGLGTAIRSWVPWTGLTGFAVECTLWLVVVAVVASPLLSRDLRDRLIAAIPR
jgi:hypothetical protein